MIPSSGEAAPSTREPGNRVVSRTRSVGQLGARLAVILVWALMALFYGVKEPGLFLKEGAVNTIFGSQLTLVFLAAALLCTICVGEFVDLSVPSVFCFSAVTLSILVVQHGQNVVVASAVAVLASMSVAAVNGLLIVYVGVNTIVVTLGMGTLLLGLSLWMTDLLPISGLPVDFSEISLHPFFGLPAGFYEGLALMLAFAYVLHLTPLGLHMRFVGANREVARLSGVRVDRLRFGAFVASGAICGAGAVLSTAAIGGFDPNTSQIYLLPTFAATFLGTAVLFPGRFNPLGTWVAIYFLATGILGLQLMGVASWVSQVFYGGVLVVAVTISTVLDRRST